MIAKRKYQTQDEEDTNLSQVSNDSELEREAEKNEARSRMVYSKEEKNLDMGNLRATDYKYNRYVHLPKPKTAEDEALHEIRKAESMKVFKRVKKQLEEKQEISNLTKAELRGLKSLQSRVNKGEIVVTETDKSKRFCVLTKQQYIDSGKKHTKNDTEVPPSVLKSMQTVTNAHCKWIREIFGVGTNWIHDERLGRNMTDNGESVSPLYLLIKDHKNWSESDGTPPPSRPVCSGIRGYNRHLSELVSLILEPISHTIEGSEIDSTSALLEKVQDLNERLASEGNTSLEQIPTRVVRDTNNSSESNQTNPGVKSAETEKMVRDKELKDFSENLKRKRVQGLRKLKNRKKCIPNFKAKLWAVRLQDQIYEGKSIPVKENPQRNVNGPRDGVDYKFSSNWRRGRHFEKF